MLSLLLQAEIVRIGYSFEKLTRLRNLVRCCGLVNSAHILWISFGFLCVCNIMHLGVLIVMLLQTVVTILFSINLFLSSISILVCL